MPIMPAFGWDIPSYMITGGLFVIFLLAFLISPLSRHWENVLFKIAVAGFWAFVALWIVKSLMRIFLD